MAITIGTDACEPGTVAGFIHAGLGLVYGEEGADSDTVRGVAWAIASGVIEGIRTQIGDGEAVVRDGSTLSGGEGGGGGGAPADAAYVVATSHADLTNERVATSSPSITVDASVAGQLRWTVATASTAAPGIVELATSAETTAGLAVQASDTRLSDARSPTTHASSHSSGSSDPITVTSLAGFPGGSTNFLRADGTFAAPPGATMQPILCVAAAAYLQTGLNAATLAESAGEKPYLVYPTGLARYASWFVQLPTTYAGGNLNLRLWWTGSVSDNTKTVIWQTLVERMTVGESIGSTNTTLAALSPNASSPGTAGVIIINDFVRSNTNLDGAAAGDWIRILLGRAGTSGLDTYTGDAHVLGFQLTQ